MSATGSLRNKVALKPGFSQLDWMRLMRNAKDPGGMGDRGPRTFTMADVREHASVHDAWTVIKGRVYNITPYLHYHPGGVQQLMRGAGGDSTALFNEVHPWVALSMVDRLEIGYLEDRASRKKRVLPPVPEFSEEAAESPADGNDVLAEDAEESSSGGLQAEAARSLGSPGPALDPDTWAHFPLMKSKRLGHDIVLLRFALEDGQRSGLRAGQHVMVRMLLPKTSGSGVVEVRRQYTPVSHPNAVGFLDLLVKVYPHGRLGPALAEMSRGARLEVQGPFGGLTYESNFNFRRREGGATVQLRPRHVVMIAAGSGITPMLQILKVLLQEEALRGKGRVTLVSCNRHEEDIILRSELEDFAKHFRVAGSAESFRLHLVVSQPLRDNWSAEVSRADAENVSHHAGRLCPEIVAQAVEQGELPSQRPGGSGDSDDTFKEGVVSLEHLCLSCGPEGFDDAVTGMLAQAGVTGQSVYVF